MAEQPLARLAPAKINVSLDVLRRREDGFHEIATRMAPLALADTLTFSKESQPGLRFTCSDTSLPANDSNLVIMAVRALEARQLKLPGLAIHLEKRIPHGAGLGGGSSDAAATLLGLNDLLHLGLTTANLLELASKIGSDVPFFLYESWCDCGGRGELVRPCSSPVQPLNLLLIKLPFGVPTPWAYQQWKGSQALPGVDYSAQDFGGCRFANDLERPVFEKHLVLADLKQWLRQQPEVGAALMSGSGSTVFAVLRDADAAEVLGAKVKERIGNEVWLCPTQTR